jgi:hypothetical protein
LDLRSSAFERNFVHGNFHQVDAAPVFGIEVFERQGIGNSTWVESLPLISDDEEHALAPFAAATDVNQLATVQAIAVEHCVTQGFPEGEFNELFLSENTPGFRYQAYEPVHQW